MRKVKKILAEIVKELDVRWIFKTIYFNLAAWTLVLRSTPDTGHAIMDLLETSEGFHEDQNQLWNKDLNIEGVMKSGLMDNMWLSVTEVR